MLGGDNEGVTVTENMIGIEASAPVAVGDGIALERRIRVPDDGKGKGRHVRSATADNPMPRITATSPAQIHFKGAFRQAVPSGTTPC